MKEVLFILAGFLLIIFTIFFPNFAFGLIGILLVLWLIRLVVKSAVKQALREYEKEKNSKNGQK